MNFDSTRVKIDLDAISDNFNAIRDKVKVPVMAVIKADAYGHGALQVARLLQDRAAFFGVSSMLEAMELRQAGLTNPILILGHTPVKAFSTAIRQGIRPTIFRYEDALALSEAAVAAGISAPFHLAVDTGMIGKGKRGPEVIAAMQEHGAVYFGAIGGCGALLSKCIKKAEVVAYDDLGAEAIRRLEVEDFPVIVIIDSEGNNLYESGRAAYLAQCAEE